MFKDLHFKEEPVRLEPRATDRAGTLESAERWALLHLVFKNESKLLYTAKTFDKEGLVRFFAKL